MKRVPVRIGERFGNLTVIGDAGTRDDERYVDCDCACGQIFTAKFIYVRSGHTTSCGCHKRSVLHAHLLRRRANAVTGTPEHRAWLNMRHRCNTPSCALYVNYGGRGIRVCDEWQQSFRAFLAHVGKRPSAKYSLDRINNEGHYEPGNIRWATFVEQNSNTRNTDHVTYLGETLPLAHWARRLNMRQSTLRRRLHELQWSVERAMTTSTAAYHHR